MSDPRQHMERFLEHVDHGVAGVIQLAHISHHGFTSLDTISLTCELCFLVCNSIGRHSPSRLESENE